MKKIVFISFLLLAFYTESSGVFAQDWKPIVIGNLGSKNLNEKIIRSFQDYASVYTQNINTPKIFEAYFDTRIVPNTSLEVFDNTDQKFIPHILLDRGNEDNQVIYAVEQSDNTNLVSLFDQNNTIPHNFEVMDVEKNKARVEVSFLQPIKSDSLHIALAEYVTLPSSLTLKAVIDNNEVIVLNNVKVPSAYIRFPATVAQRWVIEMEYAQPLRVIKMIFNNTLNTGSPTLSVRFLGLPGHSYSVYLNPEASFAYNVTSTEMPDLYGNEGVLNIGAPTVLKNPLFQWTDSDGDTVADRVDNCVIFSNITQEDIDGNGRGDTCDDFDRDKIINAKDNCVNVPNVDQRDTDGDQIGDVCDADESRFTEKYPWIIWVALTFAIIVFLVLLFIATKKIQENREINNL